MIENAFVMQPAHDLPPPVRTSRVLEVIR
jgi:hypothetical protein